MAKRDQKAANEDFFLAQERWLSFWVKQGREMNSIPSFAEFLGLTPLLGLSPLRELYDLDPGPDISPKIRMLCGTHWYALLKAYQLRNENDGG